MTQYLKLKTALVLQYQGGRAASGTKREKSLPTREVRITTRGVSIAF